MSDGRWNSQGLSEEIDQDLTRHSLLMVELGNGSVVNIDDGVIGDAKVSSYYASFSPINAIFAAGSGGAFNGAPHFIMSNETPNQTQTFGLEFGLFSAASNATIVPNDRAAYLAAGLTVTIWCLIANSMENSGAVRPLWASLLPQAGVLFDELYHTFDINVHAIRFQIEGGSSNTGGANTGALMIAMSEL